MQEMHVWSQRLDTGYDALDHDHHLQIALVSALADALEQGRPRTARQLVEQLEGYSAAHFRGEELLMEASGYDRLAAHRQEHQTILTYIGEIRDLLGNDEQALALPMTFDLRNDLASHIASHDRQYAEHVDARRTPGS